VPRHLVGDNDRMALLEAVVVLSLVGLLLYAVVSRAAQGTTPRPLPSMAGARWQVTHYESSGATRVVLRKVLADGASVVDEHVIASVPVDDPDYDSRFLEAMARARARLSLFESEEDS
jgi:hypothetical protein